MTLPEEYKIAREIYAMCSSLSANQKISRQELNRALRADSNDKKIAVISKAIRNMLWCGQLQKKMHRDTCQVVFWSTANSTERGDQIRSPGEEPVINYLIDPPVALPSPTTLPYIPEAEPEPPKPITPPAPKTLRTLIEEFFFRRATCTQRVLCAQFPGRKQEVLEIAESMWREGELCRDSTSSAVNVFWWVPSVKSQHTNDTIPGTEDPSEEEPEFYMMRDLKNKKQRILLRPTGDTLTLTLDEIIFIQSLKKPYVTL